MHFNYFRVLL